MVNLDWAMLPGNNIEIIYFTGVVVRNPSGNTSNIDTVKYKQGNDVKLYTELTFDLTDRVTLVQTF